jgi:antibiotic biosynthesis monooxygenase (ABM) superfamily enzyme
MFEPVEGVQGDTVVVYAFDTREHLDRWLASDERRTILEQMDPLLEGDRTMNVLGGFAGWFSPSGLQGAKQWKQAAVVLLALFPVVLVLTLIRQWLVPDLPLVLAVLVSNVISVAILAWALMPFLTSRLDGWLRR